MAFFLGTVCYLDFEIYCGCIRTLRNLPVSMFLAARRVKATGIICFIYTTLGIRGAKFFGTIVRL